MKPQVLDLSSEIFKDFLEKMDAAITVAMNQLLEKKLYSGTINGKIKITLMETTDKETGEKYVNPIFEPEVNMKIGAKGKLECSPVGGMILKKDRNGQNIIASNQIEIDDLLKEQEGAIA